jgi:hydrogenase maturation protease
LHFLLYAFPALGDRPGLTMTNHPLRWVVLGVGNVGRGDDAAGPAVARNLRSLLPTGIEIMEHGGEATALIAQMDGAERVFLIDACVSGARPGTVHRFDVSAAPMPAVALGLSSHGFGVAAAVELARALGQLPRQCIIYAIEGVSFEIGAPLSRSVAAGVVEAAGRVLADIGIQANQEGGQHA